MDERINQAINNLQTIANLAIDTILGIGAMIVTLILSKLWSVVFG